MSVCLSVRLQVKTRLGIQQCQAKWLLFYSLIGLIQDRIRLCKIKGVIMTGVYMLRTPVSIIWTTFAKQALCSPKCHFPHQDDPCWWSLEFASGRTGGHPDRSLDVKDTCLHWMNNFCYTLGSHECHFPHKDDPCPQSLETWSWRIVGYHHVDVECRKGFGVITLFLTTIMHSYWSGVFTWNASGFFPVVLLIWSCLSAKRVAKLSLVSKFKEVNPIEVP